MSTDAASDARRNALLAVLLKVEGDAFRSVADHRGIGMAVRPRWRHYLRKQDPRRTKAGRRALRAAKTAARRSTQALRRTR